MAARKKIDDRISKLPDNILVFHILSRLPTLDAVRTCVLSKRWTHLWSHITTLHFDLGYYNDYLDRDSDSESEDFENFSESGYFQNFVSMVLLRLTTPSIESFSLFTNCVDDTSVFRTSWFPALACRRIKNLNFSYQSVERDDSLISSHYIFSCHSLVQLSLVLDCRVTVPNFVHLPNLQTLELYQIQFRPEKSGNSQEIILSFPVLKKLKSYDTFWSDVQSVSFEVPLLEMVEITKRYFSDRCTINLCTSSLAYFSFDGHPSNGHNILSKPSSNVNASSRIMFSKFDGSEEEIKQWGIQACILLKQLNINHLKHLELSSTKVFSFAKESFADLPTFDMLHHLKLYGVSDDMLVQFLLKSPFLTSLTVQMGHLKSCYPSKSVVEHCENDHAKQLLEFRYVPACIHNTLKTFKMENFGGRHSDLSLAKYMMENAEHLEILSLLSGLFQQLLDKRKMQKIKEKLFALKRGSNLTITEFFIEFTL